MGVVSLSASIANQVIAVNTTQYMAFRSFGLNATVGLCDNIASSAFTISGMFLRLSSDLASDGTLVATLFKNDVASVLSMAIPALSAGTQTYSNTTSNVTFGIGDLYAIEYKNLSATTQTGKLASHALRVVA